jgi:hypothetical protein
MRRKAVVAIVCAHLLITAACIHKTGVNRATPYERAVTYNTMLAQANNSIAKGVMTVEETGLLPAATANRILTFQRLVADDHQKLTKILGSGVDSAASQAGDIQALLSEMRVQAGLLINSGGLGIKNPETQQTFTADLNSLLDLLTSLDTNLRSAGVLK